MISKLKGTQDLFQTDLEEQKYVQDEFEKVAALYGYAKIKTPIIEEAKLYKRETELSDMVTKQMYVISNGSDEQTALRPEGTAGVVRSYIENKMYALPDQPIKLFYAGDMFRHERPQKGRQRQFYQLGIECIGAKDPMIDAETIALAYQFLKKLGLKNFKVVINSLGSEKTKSEYRDFVRTFFEPYKKELCEDCQRRIEENPLRILDCKNEADKDFMSRFPGYRLKGEDRAYYEDVRLYLDMLKIPYEEDSKLVRGLDYYSDTVFEFISTDESLGSKSAILAGGRYDSLVRQLDGPDVSGIGFAAGLERIVLCMKQEGLLDVKDRTVENYIINISDDPGYAFEVMQDLRKKGKSAEMNYERRSLKSLFKTAERKRAENVIVIGDDEVRSRKYKTKKQQIKK